MNQHYNDIHTGIESVVYDEPWQASNTTTIDNPSYGVNEGRNQSNKTTVENYMIIIVYIQVLDHFRYCMKK